jgi:hypothetical protein
MEGVPRSTCDIVITLYCPTCNALQSPHSHNHLPLPDTVARPPTYRPTNARTVQDTSKVAACYAATSRQLCAPFLSMETQLLEGRKILKIPACFPKCLGPESSF